MTEETKTGDVAAPAAGDAKPADATVKTPEAPKDPIFSPDQVKVVTTIRDELKQTKSALKTAQDQLTLYQAQLATGQQAPATPAAVKDPFEGMADVDVMTVADVKKIMAAQSGDNPTVSGLKNTVAKLEVMVQDPNYQDTIKTYLPDVMKTNPAIAQAIQAAPNQLLAALNYAKMSPDYIATQQKGTTPQDDVMAQLNRIIENSEKPGSPASAGGGGALSSADRFSAMSDEEFEAHMQKVLAG